MQQRDVANYTDDKTYNKEMWLIIRTSRQHIQQREVANYTDVKTIQQRDVANYTDDNTYNKRSG